MNAKEIYNAACSAHRKLMRGPGSPQDAIEVIINTPDYIMDAVYESRRFRQDPMEWRNSVTYRIQLEARAWHRRNFTQEYK